jgi:hypothetical protein
MNFARRWGFHAFMCAVLSLGIVSPLVIGWRQLNAPPEAQWGWPELISTELILTLSAVFLFEALASTVRFHFSEKGVHRPTFLGFLITPFLAWHEIEEVFYDDGDMYLALHAGKRIIQVPMYTYADPQAVFAFILQRLEASRASS